MVDNYTLYLCRKTRNINITDICGNLTWQDSIDTLGMQLSFDIARNRDDRYMVGCDIVNIGDNTLLTNNGNEVTRGIITDVTWERYKKSITAFDYAFYLNQSKIVKQLYKAKADEAITGLCNKFGVPVGKITPISTLITKIYKDNTIAEIIKDILKQATQELGIEYRLEMRQGKLYIEPYTDLIVKATYKPASNIAPFDVTKAIGSISKIQSIQDMRNSVVVTSQDEKSKRIYAEEKDTNNIVKYGLLQDVLTVDQKDSAQAHNIARNKLKKLNRVKEDISIELLGSDNVRAGRILEIENNNFGMQGQYLVKQCTHTYQNSIHKMSLNLDKVEVV